MNNKGKVLLGHGSGGVLMHQLIEEIFLKHLDSPTLREQTDAAILRSEQGHLAFTTDSFVIDPIFFPGGDIGKLAVCGTVNDLAVSGADPRYLSVSLILEEGLDIEILEKIVSSMAAEARNAGVEIVTGDTKVVNHGKCDKIFINTTGIGIVDPGWNYATRLQQIKPGNLVLINGTMGDHGIAVMNARQSFRFKTQISSDCASLNHLLHTVRNGSPGIQFTRDATRGGVATVLNELAALIPFGITLYEKELPIKPGVRAMCEILGFDPLYMANEGKVVMVVQQDECQTIIDHLRQNPLGLESAVIGMITPDNRGKVLLQTESGGRRIVEPLYGDPLPRIC